MLGDLRQLHGTAEARDILEGFLGLTILTPGMDSCRRSSGCPLRRRPAGHGIPSAPVSGVDEEELALAVAPVLGLILGEEPQAGGDLGVEENWGGNATITSTASPSTMARRMSPSLLWLEDIDPLASTTPALPEGFRCQRMCWSQPKLALPAGGCHRPSEDRTPASPRPSRKC